MSDFDNLPALDKETIRLMEDQNYHAKRLNKQAHERATGYMRQVTKELERMNERLQAQEDHINRVKESIDLVEETLLNVLLAIRQNEYLQAWYPAQKEEPAQIVIGSHPQKIREKKDKKNV